jgi:hypothetical protein
MSNPVYLSFATVILFFNTSVMAENSTSNKDFFDTDSTIIAHPSSDHLHTTTYEGPISFKRKSFSENILVKKGPLTFYQTSISGDLHLSSGDLLGEQSSAINLTLDNGSAELNSVSVSGNLHINNGNLKIENSHIRNIKVNGLFKAQNSELRSVQLSREAHFENTQVKTLTIITHAQEKIIRVMNSEIKDINFEGGQGVVYLNITKDIKPPKVTGGRIIIERN